MKGPNIKTAPIRIGILIAAGLLFFQGGCKPLSYIAYVIFGGGQTKVKAEYTGLKDQKTAIIVSTGPGVDFEYPYARTKVALAAAKIISKNVEGVEFVDQNEVEKFQMENLDWLSMPVKKIAQHLGVTRILYLDLFQFTMHEQSSVHLLRGRIQGALRVYEINDKEKAAYSTETAVVWPEHSPVPMSDEAMAQLQMETIVKFADQIGQKFYDHKVPIK